jgi:hypothetical protein
MLWAITTLVGMLIGTILVVELLAAAVHWALGDSRP